MLRFVHPRQVILPEGEARPWFTKREARGQYYLSRVNKSSCHLASRATPDLLYRITFDTINVLSEKEFYPHTRTALLKVSNISDFLLSFRKYQGHLTVELIVFFVSTCITVINTTQLQVHLHLYADVTSEGNITSRG